MMANVVVYVGTQLSTAPGHKSGLCSSSGDAEPRLFQLDPRALP